MNLEKSSNLEKKSSSHVYDEDRENMMKLEAYLARSRKEFVLDGVRNTSKLRDYNGLKDRHLQGFFYSKGIRKHLLHIGLITKDGYIIEDKRPKIHENYQILPVESNIYEDKTKESAKKTEKQAGNIEINTRSKSHKAMNNNKLIIKNKPKNIEKLPRLKATKSEEPVNPIFNEKKADPSKKNNHSDNHSKGVSKSKNFMKHSLQNDNLQNKPVNPQNTNNNHANSERKSMEVKPLSKNDLNKWFEKCVTRLEKDPEIAITQREKLEKTKENIAKMAMKEQNLN